MRLKQPVRGIHIGGCVDGSAIPEDKAAHAHLTGSSPKWAIGYICAQSIPDLEYALLHEVAHLAADSGHDDLWRRRLKRLSGRVPAAYRKRPRKK